MASQPQLYDWDDEQIYNLKKRQGSKLLITYSRYNEKKIENFDNRHI